MTEEAVETTAEAVETLSEEMTALAEQYVGTQIPVLTFLMIGGTAVLLIAAAVAGFIFVKKHFANYRNALVAGILAQLGQWIIYALLLNVLVGVSPMSEIFGDGGTAYQTAVFVLGSILECGALFLGFKYLERMYAKSSYHVNVGSAFAYALTIYVASLFASSQMLINSCVEYITSGVFMNSVGFDTAVSTMAQNGLDAETIKSTIDGFINTSWVSVLWTGLIDYIWRGLVVTSSALVLYGIRKNSLKKSFYGLVFGCPVFFYLLIWLGNIGFNARIITVLVTLAAFADVAVTRVIIHKYMSDDEKDMKRKAPKGTGRGGKQEQKRMPKIVMPED